MGKNERFAITKKLEKKLKQNGPRRGIALRIWVDRPPWSCEIALRRAADPLFCFPACYRCAQCSWVSSRAPVTHLRARSKIHSFHQFFSFFFVFSQNFFFSLSVFLVWVSADTRTPTRAVPAAMPSAPATPAATTPAQTALLLDPVQASPGDPVS